MGLKVKRQPLGIVERRALRSVSRSRTKTVVEEYRNNTTFPSAFTTFKDRDVVIYKRRTGTPQTIIMFTEEIFAKHIAPKLK